ncbi:hypothetical protein [Leptodesmis sp.]|uniref:hypothetical protein n=1 Tax=Leptodesmis sp. TaxID=3100501 RepID=UPI0040534CAB
MIDGWQKRAQMAQMAGMEAQRLSELADGVWQNIQCISEEQTLELLAQAGFTRTTRFYAGFIFAGWFAFTE